jgi:hypothetical protein
MRRVSELLDGRIRFVLVNTMSNSKHPPWTTVDLGSEGAQRTEEVFLYWHKYGSEDPTALHPDHFDPVGWLPPGGGTLQVRRPVAAGRTQTETDQLFQSAIAACRQWTTYNCICVLALNIAIAMSVSD